MSSVPKVSKASKILTIIEKMCPKVIYEIFFSKPLTLSTKGLSQQFFFFFFFEFHKKSKNDILLSDYSDESFIANQRHIPVKNVRKRFLR